MGGSLDKGDAMIDQWVEAQITIGKKRYDGLSRVILLCKPPTTITYYHLLRVWSVAYKGHSTGSRANGE